MQRECDREDADELYHFAWQDYRRRDTASAARSLKKALVLCPEHPRALELLGQIYFQAGQYADAAYYLGLLVKQPARRVEALYNLASAQLQLGRKQEAEADFRQFVELTKTFPEPKWAVLRESTAIWLKRLSLS